MSLTEEKTTRSDEGDRALMTVERGLSFFTRQDDLLGTVEQLQRTKFLPEQLINGYINEALKGASVRKLEDGGFFGEIEGFEGVWASDEDLAVCVAQLREVLFDWLVLKIEANDRDIPVRAGINLNVL
jgi:predicted RNase H-like HicB family nuclease